MGPEPGTNAHGLVGAHVALSHGRVAIALPLRHRGAVALTIATAMVPTMHCCCAVVVTSLALPLCPRCCVAVAPTLPPSRSHDLVTIPHCNGAVTRVAKVLSPPSAGIIALVMMMLLPPPRWCWVACHCPCHEGTVTHVAKALWPTLMPFAFALARLSSAGRLCCAGGINCSSARCIVARNAMVPLPTLHWRCLVSRVFLVAKGLAGCFSDLATVASRSHCRQPAATALPPLQPSTPLRSCHRRIASALSWS